MFVQSRKRQGCVFAINIARTRNATSLRDQYSNKILKTSAYNMVTIISVLIRRDTVVYNLCIFHAFDQGF